MLTHTGYYSVRKRLHSVFKTATSFKTILLPSLHLYSNYYLGTLVNIIS